LIAGHRSSTIHPAPSRFEERDPRLLATALQCSSCDLRFSFRSGLLASSVYRVNHRFFDGNPDQLTFDSPTSSLLQLSHISSIKEKI
jgi:hypothetical protein